MRGRGGVKPSPILAAIGFLGRGRLKVPRRLVTVPRPAVAVGLQIPFPRRVGALQTSAANHLGFAYHTMRFRIASAYALHHQDPPCIFVLLRRPASPKNVHQTAETSGQLECWTPSRSWDGRLIGCELQPTMHGTMHPKNFIAFDASGM
jgi:hypothetical protein